MNDMKPFRDSAPAATAARAIAALCGASALALAPGAAAAQALPLPARVVAEMSLEELGNVLVTSVTGRPAPAHEAAASVFVITAEDIRRSTARSLPEALRLAPNLQVARLNANQWAISARGFNTGIGNKLLVLVDGRTIYSPLFSGVFWDSQEVLLQDIERIEVISGPGATLWGANAVNGVINVITRAAGDTQGALLLAQAGEEERQFAARYGGRVGAAGAWRAYAMHIEREPTELASGAARRDGMRKQQVGMRADWKLRDHSATLQGDLYRGHGEPGSNLAPDIWGGNLLGRWQQTHSDGSNWQLQGYLDVASRYDDVIFRDRTRTLDLQFNHVPVVSAQHRLLWGMGYRNAVGRTQPTALVRFNPAEKTLHWSNVFVQNEWG